MKTRAIMGIMVALILASMITLAYSTELSSPDANTVLLDYLNGTTLGNFVSGLTYVESLPNLGKAGNFAEGTYIRYDLHAWYSSGWDWGSANARGTVESWIKPRKYGGEILDFNWFNTRTSPASGHILHFALHSDGKLAMSTWTGGDAPAVGLTGVTTIPLNEWTHVAVSWSPTVTKLYVNGAVDASIKGNIYPAMGWYGQPYVYAYLNTWGEADFGYIDELHISKVQRTDNEIWSHYAGGFRMFFADGFESGSFSRWGGTSVSFGETAAVTSTNAAPSLVQNRYSARFTSNGGGGYERAYCYKNIESSRDLYANGYFAVSSSGIVDNGDRFYFIALKAGSNIVAYAGWGRTGGVLRWCLMIRSGTGWVTVYSATSPSLYRWYSVQLHWFESTQAGYGKLWVDGKVVCSISGKNTASFGAVNLVNFGMAQLVNCGSTRVYCDDCNIMSP